MAQLARMSSGVGQVQRVNAYDWTICHRVPIEHTQVGGRLAFVIHASVGSFAWNPNTSRHQVELCMASLDGSGNITQTDGRERLRIRLNDSSVGHLSPNGGEDAYPVQIVQILDSSLTLDQHPQWGDAWKVADQLAIVGRLIDNGDGRQGGSFEIADVTVLTFDLATLDDESVPYDAAEYAPRQPQALTPPPNYRVLDFGFRPGGAVVDETWLVFHSWTYRPYQAQSGPALVLFQSDGATGGGTTEDFRDFLGMDGVEQAAGAPAWLDNQRQLIQGGFTTYKRGATFDLLGWQGRDGYQAGTAGNPQFHTAVKRANWFAVRIRDALGVDDFYNVKVDDDYSQFGQTIDDLFAPVGVPGLRFETTPVNPTKYVLLTQARAANAAPAFQSWRHFITGTDGSPVVSIPAKNHVKRYGPESTPFQAYVEGRDLAGDAAFEILFASGIASIPGAPRSGSQFRAVGLGLENDPSTFGLPAVTPSPIVALVPGRESPDVGSLEVLPFEPQAQIAEVQDVPAHTFQGDTGYRWNLPRFAQARRSLQLQFVGLSASERDQLLEFLRVNVTFAWTPPGQVATAFIVTDRPTTSSDSSLTYGLSVRVFELVFTGGA